MSYVPAINGFAVAFDKSAINGDLIVYDFCASWYPTIMANAAKKVVNRTSSPRLRIVKEPVRRPKRVTNPDSVIVQFMVATHPENRLAAITGLILGGFVPTATFTIAHNAINHDVAFWHQLNSLFVAGGLAYSAITVFKWGCLAFQSKPKALGFVILIEGVMTFAGIGWLAAMALALLVTINGIATACNLVNDKMRHE